MHSERPSFERGALRTFGCQLQGLPSNHRDLGEASHPSAYEPIFSDTGETKISLDAFRARKKKVLYRKRFSWFIYLNVEK